MDTVTLRKPPQWSIAKRCLLFLGLGAVLTIILLHALSPANTRTVLAVLGVALLAGVIAGTAGRLVLAADSDAARQMPVSPAGHREDWPEMTAAYYSISGSLRRLAEQSDCILLEAAIGRLVAIQEELRSLADGRIVFTATEAWRTVYDEILRSPGIGCYRSVAWLRNEDYWRDTPGQRSMQTNYDLLQDGVGIERILILCDFFWPAAAILPASDIRRWIDEQYKRGVVVRLVRESEIDAESTLLCDMGIYGTRATGTLELDPQCRTTRFTFDFSAEGIRLAEDRWKRLSLYTISYTDLLDRSTRKS